MKFSPNTNIEYIRFYQLDRIRISNIFIIRQLTKYEYRIYSFLATRPNKNIEYICSLVPDQIRISYIFIPINQDEYEYQIYIMQTFEDPPTPISNKKISPNRNIKYIHLRHLFEYEYRIVMLVNPNIAHYYRLDLIFRISWVGIVL